MGFLFRALFIVVCLVLQPSQAQITPRKVWFDDSCRTNDAVEVDKLWSTIVQMKSNAQDAARGIPNTKLYDHIFQNQNNAFIQSTLNAISGDLVPVKDANTFIFCDEDGRFVDATEEQVPGNSKRSNKVKIDKTSNILYKGEKLKCAMSTVGGRAMGATYCNHEYDNQYNDKQRCSITLCNDGIRFKSRSRRAGLHAFQNMRTDFAKVTGDVDPGPTIDHWNLLDTVILHEITHSIYNEVARLPVWDDLGYGWKKITALNSGQAVQNADSLAYLGLGSWLEKSADTGPYAVLKSGTVKKA